MEPDLVATNGTVIGNVKQIIIYVAIQTSTYTLGVGVSILSIEFCDNWYNHSVCSHLVAQNWTCSVFNISFIKYACMDAIFEYNKVIAI